jgi:hypothetical protein
MCDDSRIPGIVCVPVAMPVGRMDVDLHVPGNRPTAGRDGEYGIKKIRARLKVPAARIPDGHDFTGESAKDGRSKSRIEPDALEVAF